LFVNQDLPFFLIEKEDFADLIGLCRKSARDDLIKADALRDALFRRQPEVKSKLKQILQDAPHRISLTTDLWTSIATRGFITITAHWVDDIAFTPARLQRITIVFKEVPGRHTGERLAEVLHSSLQDLGIWTRILAITIDNASNNDVMMEHLWSKLPTNEGKPPNQCFPYHIRCMNHVMQLGVNSGMKGLGMKEANSADNNAAVALPSGEAGVIATEPEEQRGKDEEGEEDEDPTAEDSDLDFEEDEVVEVHIDFQDIIRKVQQGSIKVRKAPTLRVAYDNACAFAGIPLRALINYSKTRWNSERLQLHHAWQQRKAWDMLAANQPLFEGFTITTAEWDAIRSLDNLLSYFLEATKFFSSGATPTIGVVVAFYNVLMDFLEDVVTGRSATEDMKKAAKVARDKMQEYYARSGTNSDAYMIALLLDPHFNFEYLRENTWGKPLEREFKKLLISVAQTYDKRDPGVQGAGRVGMDEDEDGDDGGIRSRIYKKQKR